MAHVNQNGTTNRETWAQRHNVLVGQQIRHYRKAAGLTVDALTRQLEEIGYPISRAKLTNLERARARQEGVSVPEVMALAYCLGVPPVQLIFPLEANPRMHVLPGVQQVAWEGLRWFTGTDHGSGLVDEAQFKRGSTPLAYRRSHDYLMDRQSSMAQHSRTEYAQAQQAEDELARERHLRRSEQAASEEQHTLRQLVMTRQAMQHAGIKLPDVEPALRQRLDELEDLMSTGKDFG